jgi:hypothetical protein
VASVDPGMGFRDRFFTPKTAKAILSWRIVIGVGVAAALAIAGLPIAVAIGVGIASYAGFVAAAMPRQPNRQMIDPFALSEPWRQLMQGAQGADRKLTQTVAEVAPGPLRAQLDAIVDQLRHGLQSAWDVAKQGDAIDDTVRRLDPTALRSKLATLEQRAATDPSPENLAALESVRGQIGSADRLKRQSEQTAASLRLTQTQLDALVARAAEVRVGAADSAAYAKDVDELVIKLEALRQAVEETKRA